MEPQQQQHQLQQRVVRAVQDGFDSPSRKPGPAGTKPTKERRHPSGTVVEALQSRRVVLPSKEAAAALLLLPPLLYLLAAAIGVLRHIGVLLHGTKYYHLMLPFEKQLFRPYGPLLPLAILMLRIIATHVSFPALTATGTPPVTATSAHSSTDIGVVRICTTLVRSTAVLYVLVALVRSVLYMTHVGLQIRYDAYLLSDHLFLGAAVAACLHSELVCCFSDYYKLRLLGASEVRQGVVVAIAATATLLYLATCGDMYFTGRHFHLRHESVTAVALGVMLFQAPVVVWLALRRLVITPAA